MSTMETDRVVDDYLRRLEAAAAHLQRSRRAELVAEIREHIEAALLQEEALGEAAVRNVLERLGPPEEIVDAVEPPPAPTERGAGKLEVAALITLVVPFIGWLFGIALVLASHAWSGREKLLGVAFALIPALLPLAVLAVGAESGSTVQEPAPPGPVRSVLDDPGGPASSVREVDDGVSGAEVAVFAFLMLAGLPSAIFLGWRLRRHPERISA